LDLHIVELRRAQGDLAHVLGQLPVADLTLADVDDRQRRRGARGESLSFPLGDLGDVEGQPTGIVDALVFDQRSAAGGERGVDLAAERRRLRLGLAGEDRAIEIAAEEEEADGNDGKDADYREQIAQKSHHDLLPPWAGLWLHSAEEYRMRSVAA